MANSNSRQREMDHGDGLMRLVKIPEGLVWIPARAITVAIPWAWTMLAAPEANRKDFENRSPGFSATKFRGPVWLHNGAKWSNASVSEAAAMCAVRGLELPTTEQMWFGQHPTLKRCRIVGLLWFSDCLPPTFDPSYRWHFPRHHGFRIARTATVDPVECHGQRGFWSPPPHVAAQLARQVWARPDLREAFCPKAGGQLLEPLDIQ